MTNPNPASTLAADLLRYADLIEDEFAAGQPRKVGDAADCASPLMRQAAAALRASTPSAAPVAVGEIVGWRPGVKCVPPQNFNAGKPTERDIDYWRSISVEIEYAYAHPPTAQVAERQPLTGWQPIETAPQTGRTLLLGYFNALGKWRTLRGQWFTDAMIQEEWTNSDVHEAGWFETSVECDGEDSGCWPTDPTHWMPLPQSPSIGTTSTDSGEGTSHESA